MKSLSDKSKFSAFVAAALLLLAAAPQVRSAPADERVLVAGATGRTGEHVVEQLLAQGYKVRALVRDSAAAREQLGPEVEIVVGDVTKPATLGAAVSDVTYVISAIGSTAKAGPGSPEFIDYKGNNNLVDAAVAADVQQFVVVSSMGVTHENHPLNKMLNNVLIWKLKNEDYLRSSGLAYTIVRPGGLLDGPAGEQRVIFEQGDVRKVVAITRADVAAVCVAALQYPEARGKTFEVFANKKQPFEGNWQQKFAALK